MALSNTAVPKYYGIFRDSVIRGEIPVNEEISMEMNRIDDLIEELDKIRKSQGHNMIAMDSELKFNKMFYMLTVFILF